MTKDSHLEVDAKAGSSQAIKVVGSIVANVTLLTSLLFYFGFLYTQVFFGYFRVHYTVLGQTFEEILARGVDGLLVPLAAMGAATLVSIVAVQYLRIRLRAEIWLAILRVCTPLAVVIGLMLVGAAVIIASNPGQSYRYAGLPGLGFAVGVLLLVFAWRRWSSAKGRARSSTTAEWGVTFLLVIIGLFWAVGNYSVAVGLRRAFETEMRVPTMSNVLVYSAKSLNLTAEDVHEVVCEQPEAAYRYRYDGLKLLLQSSGQYVFLPVTWTSASGAAIVIARTDTLRLEFTPASAVPNGTC